jgi:hypothetical protein
MVTALSVVSVEGLTAAALRPLTDGAGDQRGETGLTNQRPTEEPQCARSRTSRREASSWCISTRWGGARRLGEILELLGDESHRRFHVRWEDGRESIFFPAEDTIIEPVEPHRRPQAG